MRKIKSFLSEYKTYLIITGFVLIFTYVVSEIYKLHPDTIFYLLSVVIISGFVYLFIEYRKEQKKINQIKKYFKQYENIEKYLDNCDSVVDKLYCDIIKEIITKYKLKNDQINKHYVDWQDMITLWLHQIKLPISSLSLMIDNDEQDKKMIKSELLRIEQYSSMVMAMLRTESDINDFVFDTIDINQLIKKVIKTFKYEFFRKQITLNYQEGKYSIVSDKKALQFILEQILSNALKYTNKGSIDITIYDNVIEIKDTGIGIVESDLPRIFDKSYSGINGHETNKSSGMGLYLSKKMAHLIDADIKIESQVKQGTIVKILFNSKITKM